MVAMVEVEVSALNQAVPWKRRLVNDSFRGLLWLNNRDLLGFLGTII